jgi:hypothetical protein
MTNRCVAALGVVVASGATAASSAEKHRDLHIVIETIDHSKQRYPTVGDWQIDKAGNLHIAVSRMSDRRYEFLIGMHEAIEAYFAIHAGVSPEVVDKFDRAYEAKRKTGDDSELGDGIKIPGGGTGNFSGLSQQNPCSRENARQPGGSIFSGPGALPKTAGNQFSRRQRPDACLRCQAHIAV